MIETVCAVGSYLSANDTVDAPTMVNIAASQSSANGSRWRPKYDTEPHTRTCLPGPDTDTVCNIGLVPFKPWDTERSMEV